MVAFYNEIDPACCDILRFQMAQGTLTDGTLDARSIEDLTATDLVGFRHLHFFAGIGGFPLGCQRAGMDDRFSIATAGFPCQDLSVAGKRAGLAGGRSGLFFQFARILEELQRAGRPAEWVVLENVPGLYSSWSAVEPPPDNLPVGAEWEVEEASDLETVLVTLAELGYRWAFRRLDAQYDGLAQRRKRVFVVANLGGWPHPGEVLFEPASLCWDSAPSREAKADVAGTVDAGSGVRRGSGINPGTIVAAPLTAGMAASKGVNRPGRRREDDENLVVVNAVDAHMGMGGPDDNAAQAGHLIVAYGSNDTRGPIDIAATVKGDMQRLDFESETFLCQPYIIKAAGSHDKENHAIETDRARCLDQTGGFAAGQGGTVVAYQCHGSDVGQMGTLRAGRGDVQSGVPFVQSQMRVRRLMPIEAERLQGFPDQWTRFRADGTPLSDSARYRALGNAAPPPVVEWIMRRIQAATE